MYSIRKKEKEIVGYDSYILICICSVVPRTDKAVCIWLLFYFILFLFLFLFLFYFILYGHHLQLR
jgi:hypothetical protein